MRVRDKLLKLFNQYKVEANEDTLDIAKDFKFKYDKKKAEWVSLPREIKGEKISQLFQKFLSQYKKHYRVDVAAKEFYQLTDEEIEDMFDELPYYLQSLQGREIYKVNAASFLKERVWKQDYPNKPKRDRTKKVSIEHASNWDEYINALPEEQRSAAEAYRTIIQFDAFKSLINGRKKE
jgi:hypothetical protein